jgi:sugar phosphate isomerase/epimerase
VYAATQPRYDPTPALPQIFADLAAAGITNLELMHQVLRNRDVVERAGELSRKHGVAILGTSFSGAMWDAAQQQAVLDDAELVLTNLAKLGGRTFGASVGQAPKKKTPEQLDTQAGVLRKIIVLGRKHGVVVNLHNHTYEVTDNLHDLKGTLERIPDAPLGPDLNWLVRGGVDPVWFIQTYGRQIAFLHLRNQFKNGRWSESLAEGDMNYDAIGAALRAIPFQGDAVIELAHERDFKPTRPLRESWKMSRDFVREKLGC